MRIDYFLASESLADRIVSCEMHGQGIELQGALSFFSIIMFLHIILELNRISAKFEIS